MHKPRQGTSERSHWSPSSAETCVPTKSLGILRHTPLGFVRQLRFYSCLAELACSGPIVNQLSGCLLTLNAYMATPPYGCGRSPFVARSAQQSSGLGRQALLFIPMLMRASCVRATPFYLLSDAFLTIPILLRRPSCFHAHSLGHPLFEALLSDIGKHPNVVAGRHSKQAPSIELYGRGRGALRAVSSRSSLRLTAGRSAGRCSVGASQWLGKGHRRPSTGGRSRLVVVRGTPSRPRRHWAPTKGSLRMLAVDRSPRQLLCLCARASPLSPVYGAVWGGCWGSGHTLNFL